MEDGASDGRVAILCVVNIKMLQTDCPDTKKTEQAWLVKASLH